MGATGISRFFLGALVFRRDSDSLVPNAVRRKWIACSTAAVDAAVPRSGFSIMKSLTWAFGVQLVAGVGFEPTTFG